MLVPFINWDPLSVQVGTAAIAPPGALMHTPSAPSALKFQVKHTCSDPLGRVT